MSISAIVYWYHNSLSHPNHPKIHPNCRPSSTYHQHPLPSTMPQYDAYEEPLALTPSTSLGEGHDGVQAPPSIALGQPGNPIIEPNMPAKLDTGIYTIPTSSNNDPFHSAMSSHTHLRHSGLTRADSGQNLISSTLTHSASLDPSPKTLNESEKASLAAYTKAQADDDSIRLVLACERCGEDLNAKNMANDPDEFAKEAHMLNGGWMHRSRASCELLSERDAGETWETKDVEAMRARPRGAL